MTRIGLAIILFFALLPPLPLLGQSCGTKTYCREMTSCDDARFHHKNCGLTRLDAYNDGSPCENLCGDGGNRVLQKNGKKTKPPAVPVTVPGGDKRTCGSKRTCKQMSNCEEATFYLKQCGVSKLDGNADGIACNALCK
jgi:Excalibur calcium-binding domain